MYWVGRMMLITIMMNGRLLYCWASPPNLRVVIHVLSHASSKAGRDNETSL
jgi:hypothetical protein